MDETPAPAEPRAVAGSRRSAGWWSVALALLALPFVFVRVLHPVGLLLAVGAVVVGVKSRSPSAPIPGVIGLMLGGFEVAYFVFGVLEAFEDFQDWSY